MFISTGFLLILAVVLWNMEDEADRQANMEYDRFIDNLDQHNEGDE